MTRYDDDGLKNMIKQTKQGTYQIFVFIFHLVEVKYVIYIQNKHTRNMKTRKNM